MAPLGSLLRALGLLVLALAAGDAVRLALPDRAPAPAADARTHARAIVIGLDGVDPVWLERYVKEDLRRPEPERRLPAFERLIRISGLHRLRSEIPPESPVAWSSLMTGVDPGRHRITDFVRPSRSYRPENGMVDVRRMRLLGGRLVLRPPIAAARLAYPTFLERVAAAGYPVLAIRQPGLFPAKAVPGAHLLSGLGTPDLAGGPGYYAVWSSRAGFPSGDTTFGGTQIPLDPEETRAWDTTLPGPVDPSLPRGRGGTLSRATAPLHLEVVEGDPPAVAIRLADRTEVVPLGGRSSFFVVPFELDTVPHIHLRGHVRFEVKQVDPLMVLADPVNIYAPDPVMALTTPKAWSEELWEEYGPFETVGWTEQTFALNDEYQDDEGFLRDLLADMDQGEKMLLGELERGDACVFQVFTATDRALHCFYRYYDPEHPAYVKGKVEALGDPMLRVYTRADRVLGDVMARLGPNDLLIVASDHGFQTWRWQVNLNRWLVDEGYMVLKRSTAEQNLAKFGLEGDTGADAVDWPRTRAFAMGLGQIFLNVRGRESEGIVSSGEAPALAREIREKLLRVRDPRHPENRPIREVYLLHEVYHGPYVNEAADLQVGFDVGYRVAWQTALLGDMSQPLFVDNKKPWSGDHCSTDVSVVPGILLLDRPLAPAPPDRPYRVHDVAATVLDFFGLDTSDLEGRPLPR